ncbi:ATP-binding cassette sub-family C member 9 [Holothuria leucospilota]|uniref:ATP-binding cassette sub-family C member 9 n=1 Tax=Holothuria leucospilota TaxID=206669 RepID=A0A9Q1HJH2_HOLLE|nr:ATP-binding cassette sub-family C member 9 [Holothuria leucospilota]
MRREERTVVLTLSNTKNINYEHANHIIIMDKGTVKEEGPPQYLGEIHGFWSPWQRESNVVKYMEDTIELERLNLQTTIKKEFSKENGWCRFHGAILYPICNNRNDHQYHRSSYLPLPDFTINSTLFGDTEELYVVINVSRLWLISFCKIYNNSHSFLGRNEQRFDRSFLEKLDKNGAVSFYLVAVKRWLAIRLDYLGTAALLIAGLSAVIGSIHFGVSVSFVGLSLAYSLQITYFLSQWVRAVSRLELSMNSVERIKSYCNVATERYDGIHPGKLWPSEGSVHLRSVHVRYAQHLDAVLKDVTLQIIGGQKVGICGRTGSGKSTLALSLIRFVDIFKGCIEIDGVNIKSIPLKVLRQRVAIIQQDAVLFSGTDRLVGRVVEEQFQNKTIITIVHRIHTIINYDSVVVLDNGNIVEYGPPHILLQNPGGIFTSMVKVQLRV